MKVLILSPLPPPVGGIASWTMNIIEYYKMLINVDFKMLYQNTAMRKRAITQQNFFFRIYSGIQNCCRIFNELEENILKNNPDVIHLTSSASLALMKDLLILRKAKKWDIPVILHFHFGRIPDLFQKNNWEWRLLLKVISRAKQVIVIDNSSYKTLFELNISKIKYIPNPISIQLESIAKSPPQIPAIRKQNRVLFIGHIIAAKGVFELVNACKNIKQVEELVLIGPFQAETREQILQIANEKRTPGWVKFTGAVEKKYIYDELRNATVMVLPSYSEGFPNAILEAMALGCPIIASNVGAIPEMLNIDSPDSCGICIPAMDVQALEEAISNLINDIEKQSFFSENERQRVLTQFTSSVVCKEYEIEWQKSTDNFQ